MTTIVHTSPDSLTTYPGCMAMVLTDGGLWVMPIGGGDVKAEYDTDEWVRVTVVNS